MTTFGGPRRFSVSSAADIEDSECYSAPRSQNTESSGVYNHLTRYAECGDIHRPPAQANGAYSTAGTPAEDNVYAECGGISRPDGPINPVYGTAAPRGPAARNAVYAVPDGVGATAGGPRADAAGAAAVAARDFDVYIDMMQARPTASYHDEASYGMAPALANPDECMSIAGPDGAQIEVRRGNSGALPGPHYFDTTNGEIYVCRDWLNSAEAAVQLSREPVYADVTYGSNGKLFSATRQISYFSETPDDIFVGGAEIGELVRVASNESTGKSV